jgi:hypothetical protein
MFINIYNITPMLRPIRRYHTNINFVTHFMIHTDMHRTHILKYDQQYPIH